MGLSVVQVAYALAPPVSPDAVGGAEQVMALLDAGLASAGHEVAMVAAPGSLTAGRLFPAASAPDGIDGPARFRALEVQAAALRAALAAARADVVHLHGTAFRRVLPPGGPPALATLHLAASQYRPDELRDPSVAFACVSEAQARALPPGVRVAAVVPNGVPLDVFRPDGAKEGYALVLARVCVEKGIAEALRAARRAGAPLVVGGQVFPYPEHRRYFDDEVRPLLDGSRRFVGPVGGREKRRLLARARCLVAASRVPETSSLVAMEALASGTPVVAYRAGALPEIVEDGATGFLVDGEADLADAIREAGRLSPASCRRAAEARFGAERVLAGYARLYRRLARRRNPSPPPGDPSTTPARRAGDARMS